MASDARLEDDQVHVLDEGRVRRSRAPLIAGLALLIALGGAGAWVALEDPFGDGGGLRPAVPAADNLLGEGWSFETGESSRPGVSWQVEDGAPAGFRAGTTGVVSGVAAGVADLGPEGWARSVSSASWRVEPGRQVELAGVSSAEGVQLFVRFEADDRPAFDAAVASGRGELVGRVTAPAGYRNVRAGVGSVGPGAVDDLVLKLLPQADGSAAPYALGIFEVHPVPGAGALVLRGQELVLRLHPVSLRAGDGPALPGPVGWMPGPGGADVLRLADGQVVDARATNARVNVDQEGSTVGQGALRTELGGVPVGSVAVREVLVAGSLAKAPVGVRVRDRYEDFEGDFGVEGVEALVLGRTQDRFELRLDRPFDVRGVHRDDGTIALSLELPRVSGKVSFVLSLAADFSALRANADELWQAAEKSYTTERYGEALDALDTIIARYPYDEQLLADALRRRGEISELGQTQLDSLTRNLDEALFMRSASRCKEVRDAALQAAQKFAKRGDAQQSDLEAAFRERATRVDELAAELLTADREGRVERLTALRDSFSAGGYPSVAAEFSRALEALASDATSQGDEP